MRLKNKIIKIALLVGLISSVSSCKKFLTVEPIDRLTGNNFYQTKSDVEANIARIYSQFFEKINESWVMGGVGEARSGEIFPALTSGTDRQILAELGKNNMLNVVNFSRSGPYSGYAMYKVTEW
ncbi:RagB/SusD family nutrient uptake outer membrane protein, partial [Sphingobacterium faecium]|nr:RagB/SusD family nutrient uptake outer membrane protein [Sphingobacterium faecium]